MFAASGRSPSRLKAAAKIAWGKQRASVASPQVRPFQKENPHAVAVGQVRRSRASRCRVVVVAVRRVVVVAVCRVVVVAVRRVVVVAVRRVVVVAVRRVALRLPARAQFPAPLRGALRINACVPGVTKRFARHSPRAFLTPGYGLSTPSGWPGDRPLV